jgi:hypothetical protein
MSQKIGKPINIFENSRFSLEVQKTIFGTVIDSFESTEHQNAKAIWQLISSKIKEKELETKETLTIPSYSSICRLLRKFTKGQYIIVDSGKEFTSKSFEQLAMGLNHPFDVVHIDHTEFDVFLIGNETDINHETGGE